MTERYETPREPRHQDTLQERESENPHATSSSNVPRCLFFFFFFFSNNDTTEVLKDLLRNLRTDVRRTNRPVLRQLGEFGILEKVQAILPHHPPCPNDRLQITILVNLLSLRLRQHVSGMKSIWQTGQTRSWDVGLLATR